MARVMRDFFEFLKAEIAGYEGEYRDIVDTVPSFFSLLTGMLDDSRLPSDIRPMVNTALAYFISPFDFGSEEYEGAEGYVDDAFVCATVVAALRDRLSDPRIVLDHWDKETDPFELSRGIQGEVEEVLGEDSVQLILQYTGLEAV